MADTKSPTILALGDSLTFGYEVDSKYSWPSLVEKKLRSAGMKEARVINAGSSGATSAFGFQTLRFHLRKQKPDWLILALGANDGLRGLKPSQTEKNLAKVIEFAQEKGIKVLLLGMKAPPNYGSEFSGAFEKLFGDLKEKYKTEFIPFFLEGVAGEAKYNQADGIHPNPEGYGVIAENFKNKGYLWYGLEAKTVSKSYAQGSSSIDVLSALTLVEAGNRCYFGSFRFGTTSLSLLAGLATHSGEVVIHIPYRSFLSRLQHGSEVRTGIIFQQFHRIKA